ncbi:MAG: Stp1/IreP family PP2C-type Ser/Thr phosphatase [Dehalococcoidia bacterium]|nr:Stp1/IreP family PP2C-type Ser/Thr phosphatase [Dehalococcoidia bacterium]
MKCTACDVEFGDGQFCPECGALCAQPNEVQERAAAMTPSQCLADKYRIEQLVYTGMTNVYRGSIGEQVVMIRETPIMQSSSEPAKTDAEHGEVERQAPQQAPLKAEFELLQLVHSDCFARPCDYFVDGGKEYLVTDWPAGERLSAILSGGMVGEETSVRVALQLCEAIAKLHESGFAHLDIEPNNVLFDKGQVRLLNCGRSRKFDADCLDCLTTDGYSAPELSKEGTILQDGRPDIYSIGAVMYTMLTGKVLPFGDSQPHVLADVSQPELARILLQCLAANPELRCKTAGDLQQRLQLYRDTTKTRVRCETAIASDIGMVRQNNEDCGLAFDTVVWRESKAESFGLYVVADGMGGERGGETASTTAISEIWRAISESLIAPSSADCNEVIKTAIERANKEIYILARDNPALHGMGTTATLGFRRGRDLFLGHAGDSRAYLIRDGQIRQLTEDHSVVSNLLKAGMITAAEAKTRPDRGVITRSLGGAPGVVVDKMKEGKLTLQDRDTLVFCTDGLVNNVSDELIMAEVSRASSVQSACGQLVARANRAGGDDNVTVIVVRMTA